MKKIVLNNNAVAINFDNVCKNYNSNVVVDNFNVKVRQGEFLSLLGTSGAGKTTLLRLLAGLELPSSGEIYINGKNMNNVSTRERHLGMVFQQYALFPHMTVWNNVAYGLKSRKISKEVIKEKVSYYLKLTGLENLKERRPSQLSGGQQQRVGLARALVTEPLVMLFDEPLSNLDIQLKKKIVGEIKTLHEKLKFTAIYVTHDQNEAMFLSDKIAILRQGKLEQYGKPEEVAKFPSTEFVADFLGYTNKLSAKCFSDKLVIDDLIIKKDKLSKVILNGNHDVVLRFKEDTIEKDDGGDYEVEIKKSYYFGIITKIVCNFIGSKQLFIMNISDFAFALPKVGDVLKVKINFNKVVFFKK